MLPEGDSTAGTSQPDPPTGAIHQAEVELKWSLTEHSVLSKLPRRDREAAHSHHPHW
jgi:hypothetical protein